MEPCRVDRYNATRRIACYLQENHISVEQVEHDLGIERGKLSGADGTELEAAEFLELCHYLNVAPESFRG